ncbi:uncharacterized protein LOC111812119 [Octodon degus]|uniref:Uncharacterized protein LOC111812119 n=1 Tax=Octodon degus TaxID=10160 RepID=A0A6P6D4V2_OCTDE|nr:uncharacterized protein LOC111812119 [Octodon degus]
MFSGGFEVIRVPQVTGKHRPWRGGRAGGPGSAPPGLRQLPGAQERGRRGRRGLHALRVPVAVPHCRALCRTLLCCLSLSRTVPRCPASHFSRPSRPPNPAASHCPLLSLFPPTASSVPYWPPPPPPPPRGLAAHLPAGGRGKAGPNTRGIPHASTQTGCPQASENSASKGCCSRPRSCSLTQHRRRRRRRRPAHVPATPAPASGGGGLGAATSGPSRWAIAARAPGAPRARRSCPRAR